MVVHVPAKFDLAAPLKEDIIIRETPEGDIETIQFVKSCVHLGAKITSDLTDVAEITGRMIKASQMFGMLRREMLASKDTWPEVKKHTLEGIITLTMLDGAEHWVVGADQRRELNSLFNRMVRSCLRMTMYTTMKYHIQPKPPTKKLELEILTTIWICGFWATPATWKEWDQNGYQKSCAIHI